VFSVCVLAQPATKMMPQAAKTRMRLELLIVVFMGCTRWGFAAKRQYNFGD
jgi:hypothetical protein